MNKEEFNSQIIEARKLLKNGEFIKAKEIVLKALKNINLEREDENGIVLYFSDVIEFLTYVNLNQGNKVTWLSIYGCLAYNTLGYIAVEEEKYEDGIEYLNKAIELNPMDASSIIEKAECFMQLGNTEKFLECMQKAYEVAITPEKLATYYRKLGYYYADIGKYKLSYAIYKISLIFENSKIALSELMYNRQQMNDMEYELKMVDIINILKENNIPIGPNKRIINTLFGLYKDVEFENKMPNTYNEIKRRLWVFTGDERFKNNY